MIKKIFKAMLMGLRKSEVFCGVTLSFIAAGWLPLLVNLIFKIFKVKINALDNALLTITLMFLGIMILSYIIHCVEAVKYQEEKDCDFNTAWWATDTSDDEY